MIHRFTKMISDHIYFPEYLSPKTLDDLLAKGWYRMGQSIFTTHYLIKGAIPFRVFWLRYDLKKLRINKRGRRIINCNRQFQTSIKAFKLTNELEDLYRLYRHSVDFDPAISVQQWLFGEECTNVYDTLLIEVRDHDQLIAAGIYDKGENSIAGIMNFYHPEYKKFSLGKYLMLVKTAYAMEAGLKWYYPGYIVYGDPKFNYKLFIDSDSAMIYIPEKNCWSRYSSELLNTFMNTFPNSPTEQKE